MEVARCLTGWTILAKKDDGFSGRPPLAVQGPRQGGLPRGGARRRTEARPRPRHPGRTRRRGPRPRHRHRGGPPEHGPLPGVRNSASASSPTTRRRPRSRRWRRSLRRATATSGRPCGPSSARRSSAPRQAGSSSGRSTSSSRPCGPPMPRPTPTAACCRYLERMGQVPFGYPTPDGYPAQAAPLARHPALAVEVRPRPRQQPDQGHPHRSGHAGREPSAAEAALMASALNRQASAVERDACLKSGDDLALLLASPAFQRC